MQNLNDLCEEFSEDFGVRFYSHNPDGFDCDVLKFIPNVKCLYLDCLPKVKNIDVISGLKKLLTFSLGVRELAENEMLEFDNLKCLRTLYLSDTKSRAINLLHLKEYKCLKELSVSGHTKNIDALGSLAKLERLGLCSIPDIPIGFVNRLNKLKALHIILGGRKNINELEGGNIEDLEICWTRGFNSLLNINKFSRLKRLFIENQLHLKAIEFNSGLEKLEYIRVINCKNLKSIKGLGQLESLKHIRVSKTKIDFEEFIKQVMPEKLKILAFYTSKIKQDKIIKTNLDKLGYVDGLNTRDDWSE